MIQQNKEKYELFKYGILVKYNNVKNKTKTSRLEIFDFEKPENNHFLVVKELWLQGPIYWRGEDIVGFVNGIPLLFMELKLLNTDFALNLLSWKKSGFTIDNSVRIHGSDNKARESLA